MTYTIIVLICILLTSMISYVIGSRYGISEIKVGTFETEHDTLSSLSNLIEGDDYKKVVDGYGEVLLVINEHLFIQGPTSKAAIELFTHSVEGEYFIDLLFARDTIMAHEVSFAFDRFFNAMDDQEKASLLDLLPKQVKYMDRFFKLHYHPLEDHHKLAIYLCDQTTSMELVKESEDKRQELEMVISVLTHQKEYIDLKQEFTKLINEDLDQFFTFTSEMSSLKNLIKHALHQFKLNCIKLKFNNSIDHITSVEAAIEMAGTDLTPLQFRAYLDQIEMNHLIQKDQSILSQYINLDVLDAKYMTIDSSALYEVEQLIKNLPESPEKAMVLSRFNRIRYVSIYDIINRFDRYAADYARRLNKKINPVKYRGETVFFDEDRFKDMINGFIELVTNAIEHGIEYPADRYRNNKSEHGNLTVLLERVDRGFLITFEDDGRGIDINALKDELYETKKLAFDDIVEMTEQQVLNTIFLDGISTNTGGGSQLKGTGLYLFKEKVESLGGWIMVKSELNTYTQFKVYIPN